MIGGQCNLFSLSVSCATFGSI